MAIIFRAISTWDRDFVAAIRRHYTGSRGAPPGRKLAWEIWENGVRRGWIGVGEPPYKLAARRRLGLLDARPLPGTVCDFIFRIEVPGQSRCSDILRAWHPVARAVWRSRYGEVIVHWESLVDAAKVASNIPGYCYRRAGYRVLGVTTGWSAQRRVGNTHGPRKWVPSTVKIVLYRGPLSRSHAVAGLTNSARPSALPSCFPTDSMSVQNHERRDWNTPPELVHAILRAWPFIRLDPCSNLRSIVPAIEQIIPPWETATLEEVLRGRIINQQAALRRMERLQHPSTPPEQLRTNVVSGDGLAVPWEFDVVPEHALVYVNPPYGFRDGDGRVSCVPWLRKAAREERAEVLFLLPARTETRIFQQICFEVADALCFLDGRVEYLNDAEPAPFASCFVYFGRRLDLFKTAFAGLGKVLIHP